MTWTCGHCQHTSPLTRFYASRADGIEDYACPACGTANNAHLHIPRIDVIDRKEHVRLYVPTPKQMELHLATARNVLWGGRAGTGKSWALRHDAYMRCLACPDYHALLLRRQFTELEGTHLDKAAYEAERLGAIYRATPKKVIFPNRSSLRFGHCETDDSVRQYLSDEFDIIYYDEASTFTQYQYQWINSRLRTTKDGAIPMTRLGSNPGAMWVYRYFISHDVPPDEDRSYTPKDYVFIAATIDDNPHVNLAEQEYRLNALPSEALRKMYRDGDWLAVEGQFFTEWQPRDPETGRAWHVVTELPTIDDVPVTEVPWVKYVRAIDWGFDPDEGVCTWFAMLPDRRYLAVKEYTFKRLIAQQAAREIVARSAGMKIAYTVGGTDMWMRSGQTGESIQETFARNKISMLQANQDRVNGWMRCHALLTETVNDGTGAVPTFQVYAGDGSGDWGCPNLIRTIPMMQSDPRNPGDLLQRADHWVDTWRTFAMSRPSSSRAPAARTWDRYPKEIQRALLRQAGGLRLGSESVRGAA